MAINFKIVFFFLSLISVTISCAQNKYGSIEGQFYLKGMDGKFIQTWGVNMYIDNHNANYTWAKPQGLFRIDSLAEGEHEVELISSGGGYLPVKQKINVIANKTQKMKFYLKDLKYKVYINVFKPIYTGDTAIFPTPQTCDSLVKRYKIKNLEVKDAIVITKEFETQKNISINYNKTHKAYYFKSNSKDILDVLVKKDGYIDQHRIYSYDLFVNPVDSSIRIVFYLFTKNELPLISEKTIFPFHPIKNQIAIKLLTERDSSINEFVKKICDKYNLSEISDGSNKYKMSTKEEFGLYNSFIILKKKNKNFNDSICPELEEIRNQNWGKLSGPILGFYPTRNNGNVQIEFLSNILYIRPQLSFEQMKELSVTELNKNEYIFDNVLSLYIIKRIYRFQKKYLGTSLIVKTW
jgi:hypothetical protein